MRPAGVTDTAAAIASDMVAEIGWAPSISYLVGAVLGAGSWHRLRRAMRLLVAVAFVQ